MGVRKICRDGYVVEACRCPERHPVREVECPHETHDGLKYVGDEYATKKESGT